MKHHQLSSNVTSCGCCCRSYAFLYFLLTLVLLTNASYLVSGSDEDGTGTVSYCRLCESHTMCLFPFDDVGRKCIDVENGDLDPEEIRSIVHQHNVYRNNIASGLEIRGNPGPQPPAKNMMELTWDDELARLARRWALQCLPHKKDLCRDVGHFQVWQNMNVIDLDSDMDSIVGNVDGHHDFSVEEDPRNTTTTAFMRIRSHIQSWLDEVEHFDTARVGLVDFAMENETSYVAIAGAKITRVGCGRAMYSVDLDESTGEVEVADAIAAPEAASREAEATGNKNENSHTRVEVLICNYGPIDRATPQNLYEYGSLQVCPAGSLRSQEYDHLCKPSEVVGSVWPRDNKNRNSNDGALDTPSRNGIVGLAGWEEERSYGESASRSSAISITLRKSTGAGSKNSFYPLAEFLSLVLLHIITKAAVARWCWS